MYYEDFVPGSPLTTRSRIVTGTDIDLFASLAHTTNPMFLSDEAARAKGQAARLTPAPLLFSLMLGLCYQAGLFDQVEVMAGVKEMRFLAPVHPGDILTAVVTLSNKKLSGKGGRGTVELRHELKNRDGTDVLTADISYLVRTRA